MSSRHVRVRLATQEDLDRHFPAGFLIAPVVRAEPKPQPKPDEHDDAGGDACPR
jgi:hypothetical protein